MSPTPLRLLAASALLSIAVTTPGGSSPDKTLQEIAGYRQWTRVNEKPVVVENSFIGVGG